MGQRTAFSRRAFLTAALLLAPTPRRRAWARQARTPGATPAIAIAEFMRLSQRLVGRPRLDARIGATYLNALLTIPDNIPLLARLAQPSGPDLTPAHVALERTIMEWWYTGTYTVDGNARVATHTGALVWTMVGTSPPGSCAGAFGAWSRPPRGIA